MGEVYRADDLKLDQTVALKFLPPELARDPSRLNRFHAEVRLARQVTHPNVCRVHDIGEVDGLSFLSMEFVDGEDLSVLLKRIGRLPEDKAIDIARQLCAGIAAGHRQGVLHRDLKPANVMLDSSGTVRITDFGLATLAGEIRPEELRSGTPAYMAPEQLEGREVTVKSDLYSLGLVLYEIFTGRRPFAASSVEELSRLHSTPPRSPRELFERLSPAIEKVILQCLERDPALRPESALAVAYGLPGSDPLAAALEAGETPSPEMVAAAGAKGTIRFWSAVLCLFLFISGLSAVVWTSRFNLLRLAPVDRPPLVLADLARQMLESIGTSGPVVDRAFGFGEDSDYVDYIDRTDASLSRWDRLTKEQPSAVYFWYRESPKPLASVIGSRVSYDDPPPLVPGMVSLKLSATGRLIELRILPTDGVRQESDLPPVDWALPFRKAGLDFGLFEETQPGWVPPVYVDTLKAWRGRFEEGSKDLARVEAGSFHGRLVYFRVGGPWTPDATAVAAALRDSERLEGLVGALLMIVTVGGSLVLARKNLQVGRSDRQGAFRLAGGLFVLSMVGWALSADHVLDLNGELSLLGRSISHALFACGVVWLLYVALEPYLRRRWPRGVISWNRLLTGRFWDPLIARDLLIGSTFGVVFAALLLLQMSIRPVFGAPMPQPASPDWMVVLGPRYAFAGMLFTAVNAVLGGLGFFFILLLVRLLFRRDWLAIGFVFVMAVGLNTMGASESGASLTVMVLTMAVIWCMIVIITIRFGMLAGIASIFSANFVLSSPLTLDPSAFYFNVSLFVLGTILALALYGYLRAADRVPLFESEFAP